MSLKNFFAGLFGLKRKRGLDQRIARIVAPNVVELDLKRRAKFGKLNVVPSFDLTAHIHEAERRSDIRSEFARRAAGQRECL